MRIWHLRNNEQDTKESAESEQKEQAHKAVSPLDANKEYAREEVSNAPSARQAIVEEMPLLF